MKKPCTKRIGRKILYVFLSLVALLNVKKRKDRVESPTSVDLPETLLELEDLSHRDDDWDTELYNVPESRFQLIMPKGSKKDWNNYEQLAEDAKRVGVGEQGMPAVIEEPTLKDLKKKLFIEYGFNAMLSDRISLKRSLPDVRPKG